jgi:hypothetical protein
MSTVTQEPKTAAPAAGHSSEKESLQVAEQAREQQWAASFMKELFLGRFPFAMIQDFPKRPDRPEFLAFYNKLHAFLREKTNPVEIDATGEVPDAVLDGLRALGAFGMKVPAEYGGLGFTQTEYDRVMELLGSWDASLCALLSAHQSIGCPSPLKYFGTEEQKKKYLPRLAKGAISAFALTEPNVGSDPAAMETTCELAPDGSHYIINGQKLWCTNGTWAELMVVMARHPGQGKKISAFIVERSAPGITQEHRCRFMGIKGISNALIKFDHVKVPVEDRLGQEGQGLKIALTTLNTGRLALPASCVGAAKRALEIVRPWVNERVQWGHPIGKHEAIAHKLADMAATIFAMESVSRLASSLADRKGTDIRLEAGAAKEWNTSRGWELLDDAMQIAGGRGYETEQSLKGRGVASGSIERLMRDFRINRIFEGSSEIMHLFLAREAVDTHLQVAGDFAKADAGMGARMMALPKMMLFYAWWYPSRFFGWNLWPKYAGFGRLGRYLRFAERAAAKLARQTFHGMVVHGLKLQRKQAFLFRIVDIGLELFAIAATVSNASTMKRNGHAEAKHAEELADLFCRNATRKVKRLFRELWRNDDVAKYEASKAVVKGEQSWVEEGIVKR